MLKPPVRVLGSSRGAAGRNGYVATLGWRASMAAAGEEEHAHRPLPLFRRIQLALFAGLVVLAAVFYVVWGLRYGGWFDNGVYAVTIVLLLFGLAGMWLTVPSPAAHAPPTARP